MKLKANELKVFYHGSIDSIIDEQLEGVLGKHGYRRWASGYDFEDNVRDLAFDKSQADNA